MRTLIILAMILFAGATVYPQTTRSARESKNEKGSSRSEASSRSVNRSGSKSSQYKKSTPSRASKSQGSRTADYKQKAPSRDYGRSSASRPVQETRRVTESHDRTSGSVSRSTQAPVRPEMKGGGNATRSNENRTVRPDNTDRSRNQTSSPTRVYREARNTFTRENGTVMRHQNDDVFVSRRFNLDYNNFDDLRRSDDFRREFRDFDNWNHRRHIRIINHYHYRYVPIPLEIRRVRYIYRRPVHIDLIWTPRLLHRFMYYYPTHNYWNVEFGQEIETISAYDAAEWVGTVKRLYGKVEEVYYSPEDENYILYIGAPFPYQDVSVVIPRHIANDISLSPKWYFENEHIWVVGLINLWEGKPEIVVRDEDQIRRY